MALLNAVKREHFFYLYSKINWGLLNHPQKLPTKRSLRKFYRIFLHKNIKNDGM